MLDITAAFYTNDHNILVHRLHTDLGYTDAFHQLFSSYLSHPTHYVSLSIHWSAFAYAHSSVPLDSIILNFCTELGFSTMLLNMYIKPLYAINDSHSVIHHSLADSMQLKMSAPADKMSELLPSMLLRQILSNCEHAQPRWQQVITHACYLQRK